MNRTVTRLFGLLVALTGIGGQAAYAITTTDTSTTPGGTTTTPTACPPSTTEALPEGCHSDGAGVYEGVRYTKYNCTSGVTGFLAYNLNLSECNYIGSGEFAQFSGCASGLCNSSVIYCPHDNTYFEYMGCSTSYSSQYCYYERGQIDLLAETRYYFSRCALGFYDTCGPSGNGSIAYSSNPSGLVENCASCSGLRFASGNFETYPHYGTGNSASGFEWYSNGNRFITSCRAYSTSSINDDEGSFVLSADGCPYINN